MAVPVFSTRSIGLDIALGVGGLPRGRIVELYGPESSGQTTLALHVVAEAQKQGGVCAFIDAEHALDVSYARKLGVKIEELLVSQPDNGEQALEIANTLVDSGAVDLIVIDSVVALVPRAEIDGEMGQQRMGLQARLMSQAMRKLTGAAHRHGTLVFFINQTRQKTGVVYGSPETTPGSMALKFYASVRLEIRRLGSVWRGDHVIGNRTCVKVVKNKMAPPFTLAEFDVVDDKGIWRAAEALDLGVEAGLVVEAGASYAFEGERLGQDREAAAAALDAKPALRDRIMSALAARARAEQGHATRPRT